MFLDSSFISPISTIGTPFISPIRTIGTPFISPIGLTPFSSCGCGF